MSYYEFTGKTVKEAIQKACDELQLDEALLEVSVLEESTRGFLGIVGHRDARIRVRKRDILREVMEVQEQPAEAETPTAEPPGHDGQDDSAPLAPQNEMPDARADESQPEREAAAEEAGDDFRALPSEHVVVEAQGILESILERMLVNAEVESHLENGSVFLNIKGDGSGLLIGKKGQTLDALQFLVNKIVNRNPMAVPKVEVIVDTENYRLRKRENLKEMAVKMSNKAKKTLKPVSFNPMPPSERRLIHLILAEDREVFTKSYGEGTMRRIIVYPRRGVTNKRRGR